MEEIKNIREELILAVNDSDNPAEILKSPKLKDLYKKIGSHTPSERANFGQAINSLKNELEKLINEKQDELDSAAIEAIDITAPFDVNQKPLQLLPQQNGSIHPISTELDRIIDIFTRMGFEAIESRQIDDDYNMFSALNFPADHPARDGYDTFRTEEGLIPPAHTSTMQNRILKSRKDHLEKIGQIACVSYGRVFRNEDVDATHDHTFYQCEGIFVSETADMSQLLGTLKTFFETYYGQALNIKTQPAYFPFTEPSLEFAIEKPAEIGGKSGEWLEMLGCGMIHPNVLKEAGIDPEKYKGFAWGGGVERLVMLRYGIEDLRHFESGKLSFLRKF